MAEDNEVFIEDEVITLEDTEESVVDDVDVTGIIPFVMERYHRACLLYTSDAADE